MEQNSTKNKEAHRIANRRLIVIISILGAILVALIIASLVIDAIEAGKSDNASNEIDYDFYEPDYNEDIYLDEEYLDLISGGFIKYEDKASGVTLGIQRESADDHGKQVKFLVELIYDIIEGDHESYNAAFSDKYYEASPRKEQFTKQKIYDAKITLTGSELVTDEATGTNYTKYSYTLEYKIFKNNGTFRRDIGEGSKPQYIVLSDINGRLIIDSMVTFTTK